MDVARRKLCQIMLSTSRNNFKESRALPKASSFFSASWTMICKIGKIESCPYVHRDSSIKMELRPYRKLNLTPQLCKSFNSAGN